MISDSYATAMFVMGLSKTLSFLQSHRELNVILIDLNGKVYISSDLNDRVRWLKNVDIEWID